MMKPGHVTLLLASVISVCSVVDTAFSASPSLGGVSPRGVQRGTEAVVTFSGARLGDAKEVVFYTPGFQVTKLEVVNPNAVKATVKVAGDCQLGEHSARVRTESGISELRTLWVGALPVVAEKEPNSEFTTPQKIALNVTVEGVVQYEDVDYYAVECKKGQRLSVEIEAMRLANTLFDPFIAILDSKRFELATSDDSPLLGQDAMCSIVAPADGTYYIMVRESSYQGNGACGYRLHVGTFPRPQAVYPAGGKAGEEVEVTFLGDPTGPIKQKIKLPNAPNTTARAFCQDAGGLSPSGIPFRVSAVGNVMEAEPNDDHAKATKFAGLPMMLNGVIGKDGDVDCFRFKAKKGETFDIRCRARELGSPLDPVMTLSVAGGGAVASNDDSGGPDSYFRYTFPNDAEYVLTITDHLGKGGPTYFYRVEFTQPAPRATISIPKVALYSQERQSVAVPRGGRMAVLMNVARGDFGGEVVLGPAGLPAGLSMSAENLAANIDTMPVVFEARPDAPIAGALAGVTIKHADARHPPIAGEFFQRAELVVGGPGQSIYWKRDESKLAVAVTEEAPFSVEIVEPKVPIIQNGTLNLKIVARRKKGFTAPITVQSLWTPPGVNMVPSATIPANGTEAIMPLSAAGNAQIKKWKTAVVAVSDAGKGPVWVSSQLATIEVAAPFVVANMQRGAVERGKDTEIVVKLQQVTPFEGNATVKLFGLPFKVTTSDLTITRETKEIAFKVLTDPNSPPGQHRNLFCQVLVTRGGEVMPANTGYSELRIDVPIVKSTPVKPTPTPVVKGPTPPTPPRRLTRLEMLRKEQEEREKADREKNAPKK